MANIYTKTVFASELLGASENLTRSTEFERKNVSKIPLNSETKLKTAGIFIKCALDAFSYSPQDIRIISVKAYKTLIAYCHKTSPRIDIRANLSSIFRNRS